MPTIVLIIDAGPKIISWYIEFSSNAYYHQNIMNMIK